MAGLADLSGSRDLVEYATRLALNPNIGGILHWGQRNTATAADIERLFGTGVDPAAIESWFPDSGNTPQETRRTTTFEWADGLVATVECGRPPASGARWSGPLYMYVKLRCVSRDPDVNPEPVPAPYDFTVPER